MKLAKIDSSKENTSRHLRKSFKTTFGSVFIRSAIFWKLCIICSHSSFKTTPRGWLLVDLYGSVWTHLEM